MRKTLFPIIEAGIVALIFFLAFAFGLSPLYQTFGWDNATFLYIGKAIAEGGLVPYVDISDNKGILFLMIQALGQAFSPDRWGTAFIFFGTLWATVYSLYSIAMTRLSLSESRWAVTLVLLFYSISLADGNLTEDYTLPIVLFIYYCLLKHTQWGKFPIRSFALSLLLGAGIGLTALLRLNNCVLLFPWVLYPFLSKSVSLFKWLIGVSLGLIAVCLPFVMAFKWKVLMLSWEDTVAYNFNYVDSGGGDWSYWNTISLAFCAMSLFLLFRNKEIRENRPFFITLLIAYIVGFAVANISKRYSHYQTLVIPLVLLSLILLIKEIHKIDFSEVIRQRFFRITFALSLLVLILLYSRKAVFYRTIDELSVDPHTEMLCFTIPSSERDRVALFNLPIYHAYKAGLYTTNPYCFSSVQMASVTYPKYEEGIILSLLSERTLWLVTSVSPDFSPSLQKIVAKYYTPANWTEDLIVWQKNR